MRIIHMSNEAFDCFFESLGEGQGESGGFDFFGNHRKEPEPKRIDRVFVLCPVDMLGYAQSCLADSLGRGEIPLAPQLLYKQVIDDDHTVLTLGTAWLKAVDRVAVYKDHGMDKEMTGVIDFCLIKNIPVDYRRIDEN